jgi:predicted NACHT family NTPase
MQQLWILVRYKVCLSFLKDRFVVYCDKTAVTGKSGPGRHSGGQEEGVDHAGPRDRPGHGRVGAGRGAGKTTTLYRLALDAARRRLESGEGRLPLLLALADDRGDLSPAAFLEAAWRRALGTAGGLDAALRDGGVLLLADALNEMPYRDLRDYRARVRAWRRLVEGLPPGNQVVFTCRSLDYAEPAGLHQVEIERMDDGRVQEFLDKYLDAVREGMGAEAWRHLEGRPLLELVRNPYYLSMLAYILCCGSRWPNSLATLFTGFVDALLGRGAGQHLGGARPAPHPGRGLP